MTTTIAPLSRLSWPHRSNLIGSAQTSPSGQPVTSATSQVSTISSLKGQHLHAVVQVNRDLLPVVLSGWLLAEQSFNLGVSDVTLAQFEALAVRLGRQISGASLSIPAWRDLLARSMVSLSELLKVSYRCGCKLS